MEAWRKELYLAHHGIKGQKWGIRRFQNKDGTLTALGRKMAKQVGRIRDNETAYRRKLSNITKNRNADPNDVRRFKYRNQSLAKRVIKQATTAAVSTVIGDILTGRYKNYARMSKTELTKKLLTIGMTATANVAIEDALAKSASKRYTDFGKKVRGTKDRLIQKEDLIEAGVSSVARAAPMLYALLSMKAFQLHIQNARNAKYEADFQRWGQNILEAHLEDVIEVTDFKIVK